MTEGWIIRRLNDACYVDYGTRVVKKRDGGSIFPVYGGGGATFKMDTYNREDCLVVGRFAMSEKCTRFVKGKFFLNDSGLTVRPKDEVLSQCFLNWILLFKNDIIYSFGKGSAQKNLDMDDFRNMTITYPSTVEEQRRIVTILDKEFEKIDRLRSNAEQNLQHAKDLFQVLLKREFCGNLTSLGDVLNLRRGFDLTHSEMVEGDIPVAGSGGIIGYHCEATPISPCITVGRSGSVGRVFIYDKCWAHNTVLFVDDFKGNEPRYLMYLLLSLNLSQMGGGCGVPTLNRNSLHPLRIGFNSNISEQKRIVASFDDINTKCRLLQENYTKTIALCDDLKQALLRKAFNGDL